VLNIQADKQREGGDAAPVKKYHNTVKRLLLRQFASDKERLLDLACGRGGDLLKWIDCGLKYVRGYDIAEQEVNIESTCG
jgi:mRNA (guanine-N7-)-methyltransferase